MARKFSPFALQNVLVDALNESGYNDFSILDAIAEELCYDYMDTEREKTSGPPSVPKVGAKTFRDAGVLTRDAGFVVTVDGEEFQVTIVRSR